MNHNLDISTYSFADILKLFTLDENNVTSDHLKKAKKKVLYMHPDKSNLPKEYFLFYKKALDIVVRVYEMNDKVNQTVPNNQEIVYIPEKTHIATNQIETTMKSMSSSQFNTKFNHLFETHSNTREKDKNKNEWFKNNEYMPPITQIQNKSEMDAAFETYKEKQRADMVKYTGVVPICLNGGSSGFYDEEEEDNASYICADLFSKLKFDDLRKVHKDQTVFSVSEKEFQHVKQFNSVDHYVTAREKETLAPMQKSQAEQHFNDERLLNEQLMRKKQFKSQVESEQAHKRSQAMLSNFLRIG
uniref:J domain-containing protein n=1 Tax=viral metagenome TaxID=1070528 RepID=A0A6C0HJ64_9ZZZZ